MTKLVLHLNKSLEENASMYFDSSKKIKKKIAGAKEALEKSKKKLIRLESKNDDFNTKKKEEESIKARKKEWYEKFRWFLSSDSFIVVGGRDSTSNEVIIKKQADKNDLVFHTDIAGSPFFVVKSDNKTIPEKTKKEAACATATFSKIWKLGLQNTDVFYVSPEQVTKKAKSGEFLSKGAFMIYGKTNYIDNSVDLAVGCTKEGAVMAGPGSAVKKHCKNFVVLSQGDEKASSVAKKIKAKLGKVDLDEIIRSLPAGGFKINR